MDIIVWPDCTLHLHVHIYTVLLQYYVQQCIVRSYGNNHKDNSVNNANNEKDDNMKIIIIIIGWLVGWLHAVRGHHLVKI